MCILCMNQPQTPMYIKDLNKYAKNGERICSQRYKGHTFVFFRDDPVIIVRAELDGYWWEGGKFSPNNHVDYVLPLAFRNALKKRPPIATIPGCLVA